MAQPFKPPAKVIFFIHNDNPGNPGTIKLRISFPRACPHFKIK